MRHVRQYIRPLICAAALTLGNVVILAPEAAYSQSIQLQTQASEIYAGMPFQISIVVKDFDENPQPEIDPFEIENAQVQFVGASPRVSSMVSIINGRRTERKDVTYVFNYQIRPQKEGVYTVPAIVARQNGKEVSSRPMTFTATSVQTTVDMKIELQLPERNLWVGENFEATLVWYLRKDISSHDFSVPILEMPEYFEVSEPDSVIRGQSIVLRVGSRQFGFGYSRDSVMLGGLEYTRFSIPIKLTPLQSGVITIPASQVLAELETGKNQDFWGFGHSTYSLFKAEDRDRTCTVQAIPQASRPATFTNAMGSDFSIQVSADRTIVKAGDPIELTIEISSPSALEGLILPSLNAAGLNDQLFNVSTEDPVGENIDGGQGRNIKRFKIPVRIKSDRVSEIPPLAFSYFNPKTEEFSTVRSQPIALSVTSVEKISSADVVSFRKDVPVASDKPSKTEKGSANAMDPTAGALELSLRSTPLSFHSAQSITQRRELRIALYALPFLLWFGLIGARRLGRRRQANSAQREAVVALKKAMKDAENLGAREAASSLSKSLTGFLSATETKRAPFQSICEKIDAEAYRPNATKLPGELVDELKDTVKKNVNPVYSKLVSSILAILLAITCFVVPGRADAQMSDEEMLSNAQTAYREAMGAQDRSERLAGFRRVASIYAQLAEKYPDSADILTDWGNASLGVVDFGHAVLAYKRALAIDPSIEQAKTNLAYIQAIQGDSEREKGQIVSTAFFLNDVYSRDTRLFMAALMFVLGMLLLIPWSEKTRRIMRYFSVFPFILWVWFLAGAFIDEEINEGVVMSETYLKTADHAGASNSLSTPLEPGMSVEIVKTAGDWQQVVTSSGHRGWVPLDSIERVK